jgi:hypothetical protein
MFFLWREEWRNTATCSQTHHVTEESGILPGLFHQEEYPFVFAIFRLLSLFLKE